MTDQPIPEQEVPRGRNIALGLALGALALLIAVVAWRSMTTMGFDPTIGGTTQYPRPTTH